MSKIFIDTNIIIDLLELQRPNHKKALGLIEYLINNKYTIVMSESSISDVIYICRNSEKLNEIIEAIENFTFDNSIIIANFGTQVIRNACSFYRKNSGDFEDYLQAFCAEKENCVAIFTSDVNFPAIKIAIKKYSDIG